ncbi:6-phosphogluconolactonase [Frateuria sp. Soil773]|uniref:6-phosphogluconolactonase n=1 Tax=Frateuria sp. Soil773 TaxID=1736407 RepID=UPI0006F6A6F2|nr:6-phosphogluconolactonase [Frateuria sp. Soil773]KRE97660.1 6-phosphogluconolactonase [Frateuria sp. Soil773]
MSAELNVTTHSFTDCHALAAVLAERVAEALRAGIAARGHALLAVSGGSTPGHFFDRLSQAPLDWAKVQVTLVDERWVDERSERSNARMVKARLLRGAASAARFVPLHADMETPEAAIAAIRARIDALPLPFDAVVLGMGLDGHTASFFPGGDRLAEALDRNAPVSVLPMRAPHAGEPRITLTLATLLKTRALFLHVEGEPKRQLLADARLGLGAAADYPVRAVLAQPLVPVAVYWCP